MEITLEIWKPGFQWNARLAILFFKSWNTLLALEFRVIKSITHEV